jgi:hypothetical protein
MYSFITVITCAMTGKRDVLDVLREIAPVWCYDFLL